VAGHVACMGDRRGACRVLVDRTGGKRLFRRPRHRWKENIKMDLQEVGWAGIDWIVHAEYVERWQVLVNVVVNH